MEGGPELVPGRELVHHHYLSIYGSSTRVSLLLDVINVRQVVSIVFILSGFMLLP